MLKKIAHAIVQYPRVYDAVQYLAGSEQIRRHLETQASLLRRDKLFILDIAGGTGGWRTLWPASSCYTCLDMELEKLQGFREKQVVGTALYADALHVPFRNESVDLVVCINVSHHLTDCSFELLLKESARVLKKEGVCLFMDAVWETSSLAGRVLWKFDRGSSPHDAESLCSMFSRYYTIAEKEKFSIFHHYLLLRGIKKAEPFILKNQMPANAPLPLPPCHN